MPISSNKRQVRRFLGAVGYYGRYICNFAQVTLPLTSVLKKGCTFKWTHACDDVFQSLMDVLCSYPALMAPNFHRSFKLACDVSGFAAGSTLL